MYSINQVSKKILRILFRRKDFRKILLEQMPKSSICGEIGVWKGEFSERILNLTAPSKLFLIDPWEFQSEFSDRMYGGAVAKNQLDMDKIYEGVKEKFDICSNVFVQRGKSEEILKQFDDGYFDWLYIDGNHYYEFVLNDLQMCFSKIKPGGVIAGDDYEWGENEGFPVKNAVHDFVLEKNLEENLEIFGTQFIIKLNT